MGWFNEVAILFIEDSSKKQNFRQPKKEKSKLSAWKCVGIDNYEHVGYECTRLKWLLSN